MNPHRVTGQKTINVNKANSRLKTTGLTLKWTGFVSGIAPPLCPGKIILLDPSDDKFQFLPVRNQSALKALAEKTADGFAAAFAVIERPVVDIHADEFVGEVAAHVAGVLQRVLHGFRAMIQAELDARGERVGNFLARGGVKFFVDDIAAERQRQAVVLFSPPDAEVFAQQPVLHFGR